MYIVQSFFNPKKNGFFVVSNITVNVRRERGPAGCHEKVL